MTLYDELVKLFREHVYVRPASNDFEGCACGWKGNARQHIAHLAALACERVVAVMERLESQGVFEEEDFNAVVAALGEVKHG